MKFYNQKYPDVDDIVTCLIKKIEKDVIYVELLEYDNIQGMIQYSNASTRKKKKIICTVKENKIHPLLVLTVDKEKGYIDLSNKYLSDEEKDISMEKYNFQNKAIKIFNRFLLNYENKEELAEKTIWKLEKYKLYQYLENEYLNKGNLDIFDIDGDVKDHFMSCIKNFFGNLNICSTLNVTLINTNFGGVNTLINLFKMIDEEYKLKFKILVSPNYKLEINSDDKIENERKLNSIINLIKNYCQENSLILRNEEVNSVFT